jgi:small subunit ribosomal protein S3
MALLPRLTFGASINYADTVAPTVTGVSSTKADGTYSTGEVIGITVTFSKAVYVTGTPQITLETGTTDRAVNYTSGSGTTVLLFNYTVQSGDTSSDLDYTSTSALALNGGTIKSITGVAATLTLASPGAAGSLGNAKAIVIAASSTPAFDREDQRSAVLSSSGTTVLTVATTPAVEIERSQKALRILIKTSRPGLVIGRGGEGSTKLAKEVEAVVKLQKPKEMPQVKIDIEEIRSPESQAPIVAYMIAEGLEKRQTFRRVMKQTMEKVMANRDVQGVAIGLSGRLGGADMSRDEHLKMGRIPLQTLRADIDFAREKAYLPYGVIGIKVWIYRGDVYEATKKEEQAQQARRESRSNR